MVQDQTGRGRRSDVTEAATGVLNRTCRVALTHSRDVLECAQIRTLYTPLKN